MSGTGILQLVAGGLLRILAVFEKGNQQGGLIMTYMSYNAVQIKTGRKTERRYYS